MACQRIAKQFVVLLLRSAFEMITSVMSITLITRQKQACKLASKMNVELAGNLFVSTPTQVFTSSQHVDCIVTTNRKFQKHYTAAVQEDRIKSVLREGSCKCQCNSRLAFSALMALCTNFWTLAKKAQDRLLWSLANTYSMRRRDDCKPCRRHCLDQTEINQGT